MGIFKSGFLERVAAVTSGYAAAYEAESEAAKQLRSLGDEVAQALGIGEANSHVSRAFAEVLYRASLTGDGGDVFTEDFMLRAISVSVAYHASFTRGQDAKKQTEALSKDFMAALGAVTDDYLSLRSVFEDMLQEIRR